MGQRYYDAGIAQLSLFTDSNGNAYYHAIKVNVDNTKVPSDQTDFIIWFDIAL